MLRCETRDIELSLCPGLTSEYPKIRHPDAINLRDGQAGRRLGVHHKLWGVEQLVVANGDAPVEPVVLPYQLPMGDPHLFEMDSLRSDQPRLDFSLEIAQGVDHSRKARPLAQAPSLPRLLVRLLVRIANDFARHLLQGPFGKHGLRRMRRQELTGDFDIRGDLEPGDLQVLAVSPDDI